MTIRGTIATGILLVATEFCDILWAGYNSTPTNLKIKCYGRYQYLPYVTELAVDTKGYSLYIIMRCVMILSILNNDKSGEDRIRDDM